MFNILPEKPFSIVMLFFASLFTIIISLWYYISQPINVTPVNTKVIVNPESLKEHVRILSVEHAPRDHLHPDNLLKSANYIKNIFSKSSDRVAFQSYKVSNISYQNVTAEFGPKTGKRIVIGAHYDAVVNSPGADDNASGVAVLIELAALLAKQKPDITVELVAYCLEEPPYFKTVSMGSYIHAASLNKNKADVKVMISLEMLGYYSEKDNSQEFPLGLLTYVYSDKGNFVAIVSKFGQASMTRKIKINLAKNTSMKVFSINAPTILPGIDFSDHRSYWHFGYPAVMITDTAFYRNHHYHQHTDTYDQLNYKKMASVASGIYRMVIQLAKDN